jgi:flagellin
MLRHQKKCLIFWLFIRWVNGCAAEEAAGLAISEKMRAQIRGLSMASKNSSDAVSLIQTAEGALQSTHDILQRMRELAVQSASDTNEQTIDRGALEQEFAALRSEIDEIASKTRFNDQNLIDGTFQRNIYTISSVSGNAVTNLSGYATVANGTPGNYTLGVKQVTTGNVVGLQASSITATQSSSSLATISGALDAARGYDDTLNGDWTLGYDSTANSVYIQKGSDIGTRITSTNAWQASTDTSTAVDLVFTGLGTISVTTSSGIDVSAGDTEQDSFGGQLTGANVSISGGVTEKAGITKFYATMTSSADVQIKAGDTSVSFNNGITVHFDALTSAQLQRSESASQPAGNTSQPDDSSFSFADFDMSITVAGREQEGMIIQTGANQHDELEITIDRMDAEFIGVASSKISNRESASQAITQVNGAINEVSTQRAALGALQNRVEFKIANLDTSAENIQAAESRIRDVDMAKEMTEFTKNNILAQASTAMLAQANALPQGVLQLLS